MLWVKEGKAFPGGLLAKAKAPAAIPAGDQQPCSPQLGDHRKSAAACTRLTSCIISPNHPLPSPQTINCLELWAKLLAAKADEPELRPLIYPVCQVRAQAARG